MKILLDKYYTPERTAIHCIDVVHSLGFEISEVIEPSAGAGSFSLQIPGCIAYDIEPDHDSIIKADFLALDIQYKHGRLCIGNPPFGTRNSLAIAFYKKCCSIGDYVAFILPISQYNNSVQLYEFDLVHSEVLPKEKYSGVELSCCFNIYKRPVSGVNSKPSKIYMSDVFIGEYRRGGSYKIPLRFDFAMNTYGSSIGKEVVSIGTFCQEHYVVVKNTKHKDKILDVMRTTDWLHLHNYISTPKISTRKIYEHLKMMLPELT